MSPALDPVPASKGGAKCRIDALGGRCINRAMMRQVTRHAVSSLAILVVALIGVVSAQRMVPDREAVARQHIALVYGASPADICGHGAGADAHRCPLCHKLPDTTRLARPGDEPRSAPTRGARHGNLVGAETRLPYQDSARAPPRLI